MDWSISVCALVHHQEESAGAEKESSSASDSEEESSSEDESTVSYLVLLHLCHRRSTFSFSFYLINVWVGKS